MEHKIRIMSHLKERNGDGGLGYRTESNFTMSEDDLLNCAMDLFKDGDDLDDKRIFEASIDQTII